MRLTYLLLIFRYMAVGRYAVTSSWNVSTRRYFFWSVVNPTCTVCRRLRRSTLLRKECHSNRVFTIYQILLGWKTYKYCYETDKLPNPRPTQPKKKIGSQWHLGQFFTQQIIFRRLLCISSRKKTTSNPTQSCSPQTP